MFYCAKCKEKFSFPEEAEDFTSEYFGRPVRHMVSVCPYCGSDEIEEMDKCAICGEDVPPGDDACENCLDLIRDIGDDIRGKARYLTLRYKLDYNEFMSHLMDELDK